LTCRPGAAATLYVCCMNKISKVVKGEAYRWRLSRKLKRQLEAAAKDEKASLRIAR